MRAANSCNRTYNSSLFGFMSFTTLSNAFGRVSTHKRGPLNYLGRML